MASPTALDALKFVCANGVDKLDWATDYMSCSLDVDDDHPVLMALYELRDHMYAAMASQGPVEFTKFDGGRIQIPHSNSLRHMNQYSDGSPVYVDSVEPVITDDPEAGPTPSTVHQRLFKPMPGGTVPLPWKDAS